MLRRSFIGSRFAPDGIICVTINYRLGTEGLL
jgi:carboxylesterase type B